MFSMCTYFHLDLTISIVTCRDGSELVIRVIENGFLYPMLEVYKMRLKEQANSTCL